MSDPKEPFQLSKEDQDRHLAEKLSDPALLAELERRIREEEPIDWPDTRE